MQTAIPYHRWSSVLPRYTSGEYEGIRFLYLGAVLRGHGTVAAERKEPHQVQRAEDGIQDIGAVSHGRMNFRQQYAVPVPVPARVRFCAVLYFLTRCEAGPTGPSSLPNLFSEVESRGYPCPEQRT